MAKVLVSIVVPIYNVEKYLEQCLSSILSQTYKNWTAVLVDDGATDRSYDIANKFAQMDSRFQVVRKENRGLSSARNCGLEYATGEYVAFIDSDDCVKSTFIEQLVSKAISMDAEVTACLTDVFSESIEISTKDPYYNTTPILSIFHNRQFDYLHIRDCLFRIQVSAWNKLYKVEFLKRIEAKFPEGLCFEDNPFFFRCILNAKRLAIVPTSLYMYRVGRPGSILTGRSRKFFDFFSVMDIVENELKRNLQNWEIFGRDFYHYKYSSLLHWMSLIDPFYKEEYFLKLKDTAKNDRVVESKLLYGKKIRLRIFAIYILNYRLYCILDRFYRICLRYVNGRN